MVRQKRRWGRVQRFFPGHFVPILCFGFLPLLPQADTVSPDSLEYAKIQSEYLEGNFESLSQQLETFRKSRPECRAEDSFVVARFLGVIYAANPDTREKGKYWLYKMLEVRPTSDLLDLYVSEEVTHIYDRLRQEFIMRRGYRGVNDLSLSEGTSETKAAPDTIYLAPAPAETSLPPPAPLKLPGWENAPVESSIQGWPWTANFNFLLGKKFLDSDWEPVNEQSSFGASADFRLRKWPVSIAFDGFYGFSEEATRTSGADYHTWSLELRGGVRKIWDGKFLSMRPYNAAGIASITTAMEFSDNSPYRRTGMGLWGQGGVYWELERFLNVGIDVTYSYAQILLNASKVNAGGLQVSLVLGLHL
jgi:hypothetical protein